MIYIQDYLQGRRLHIISAYAPQSGCRNDEKNALWNDIRPRLEICQQNDYLILCGDLNGHVGEHNDGYNCHGNMAYGTRNDEGRRTLDFAKENNLVLINTFFKKRSSHLVT